MRDVSATTKYSPPRLRRGRGGRRPWLGWCVPPGRQPPRAGLRQRRPSLSKEGSFLCTYVVVSRRKSVLKKFCHFVLQLVNSLSGDRRNGMKPQASEFGKFLELPQLRAALHGINFGSQDESWLG